MVEGQHAHTHTHTHTHLEDPESVTQETLTSETLCEQHLAPGDTLDCLF